MLTEYQKSFLAKIISVPSVGGVPEEGAPYGKKPREVLDVFLAEAKDNGFRTGIVGDRAGWVEFGSGEKLLGIICHLDVVPVTDDWDSDPFILTFREEADGTLTHILPRYHLPYGMNHPVSSTAELDVDLAAQYGSLKAGTYVIRRRFLRREEGETTERPFDRSWRTFPEERILYADTRLYLDRDLAASTREVEPASISFYAGEDQVLPVIIQNGRFTSTECRFAVKNLGEETISFGEDEDTLYYLEGNGEWLPVANGRHLANGLIPVEIPPGESREWRTAFQNNRYFKYGPLPKGVYRLVFQAWLEEDYQTRYPLVVEFSIREDGSGMYTGA